jgi:hypothetical protein
MNALQRIRTPTSQAAFIPTTFRDAAWATRRAAQKPDTGVHLPFLAPMLCGVRLRASPLGLEFVLPNPSGGRGVYIAAWSVVAGFAAPSLHDTLLVGRLSGLDAIGPADVRQAARSVALDGYAGQDAADAARQAQDAIDIAALRLRAQFLMTLARHAGFHRAEEVARCMDREGFNMLAGRLGWSGPQLAEALQDLSLHYASVAVGAAHPPAMQSQIRPFGEPGRTETGRWGRLLSLMHRLRHSLAEEQFSRGGTDAALLGRIMAAADRCIRQCAQLLPEIGTMLANPLPLLDTWRVGGRAALTSLHALEAASDGWDRICLLWFDARTPRMRQLLIPEIAAMTRTSTSSDGWLTTGRDPEAGAGDADMASSDWQKQKLTRNERIRAQELIFELEAA